MLILLITTATDPLHQGLHDRWARSVVVQPAPGGSGAAVVTCLVMVVLLFFVLPVALHRIRWAATRGPAAPDRRIDLIGGPLMAKLEPTDVRFFATPDELRDWFDANHTTATELWLGQYKKGSGKASVTWAEAVDEALCVGWIDGILKRIDDVSHVQRFTPRRKGSNWSAINVANVERLTSRGPDAPGRDRRVRGEDTGTDRGLLVRARDRAAHRRRGRAVPGGRRGLGGLAGSSAVVSPRG